MKHCTQCGHLLGLGRFCTNCGHPVDERRPDPLLDPLPDGAPVAGPVTDPTGTQDWRTDTAERGSHPPSALATGDRPPVVPPSPSASPAAPASVAPAASTPRVPPAVVEPPPPPRFPLFADEMAPSPQTSGALATQAEPVDDAWDVEDEEWEAQEAWDEEWDEHRSRRFWPLVLLVVLVALVVGAWLLGRTLGEDDRAEDPAGSSGETGGPASAPEAVGHTADATAEAPRSAPPNQDVDGNPTSYEASNMLDGVPETTWRAAGDGSGLKLVFTFDQPVRIAEVGLVNGYAKKARDGDAVIDWYERHRRVSEVTWNLRGGPVVRQDLEDGVRKLQTIDLEAPVETRKVVLKIVAVTEPGTGPGARDYTAISDVRLAG